MKVQFKSMSESAREYVRLHGGSVSTDNEVEAELQIIHHDDNIEFRFTDGCNLYADFDGNLDIYIREPIQEDDDLDDEEDEYEDSHYQEIARQTVQRGMAWLDTHANIGYLSWELGIEQFKIDRINVDNPAYCPMGQFYPSGWTTSPFSYRGNDEPQYYGFVSSDYPTAILDNAWREALQERLDNRKE